MRRAIPIVAAALAFSLVAQAALAAIVGGFSIELSRSRRIVLPGNAATVSVADPRIADVAVLDSHSIVVVGKAYGVTDIIVADHTGRLLMDGRVAVVPAENQRLTVIRGATTSDYVCLGRCSASAIAPSGQEDSAGPAQGAPDAGAVGSPVTVQMSGPAGAHSPP
jgi:Flp pilus assembly secretin CpaC